MSLYGVVITPIYFSKQSNVLFRNFIVITKKLQLLFYFSRICDRIESIQSMTPSLLFTPGYFHYSDVSAHKGGEIAIDMAISVLYQVLETVTFSILASIGSKVLLRSWNLKTSTLSDGSNSLGNLRYI